MAKQQSARDEVTRADDASTPVGVEAEEELLTDDEIREQLTDLQKRVARLEQFIL